MSRSTISTFELFQMFPDQESARAYFEACEDISAMRDDERRTHGPAPTYSRQ